MQNELVTLERAAKDFCVHIGTMRRWVREGRVPATRVGRKYLIQTKVLEELAAEGGLGQSTKQQDSGTKSGELELLPLWLQFRQSWYRRLYLVSHECSLSAAETLTRGIELVLKEYKEQDRSKKST